MRPVEVMLGSQLAIFAIFIDSDEADLCMSSAIWIISGLRWLILPKGEWL
ncbi:hypothetical protein [Shewanella algae]|nr:hypothetical protein [Shewanella algae]